MTELLIGCGFLLMCIALILVDIHGTLRKIARMLAKMGE